MNSLPNKLSISERLSPREIVTRRSLDASVHAPTGFGTYVEASEDAVITNDMKSRTYSGIYLGTTGNIQGTHKVYGSQREEAENKLEFLNR